MQNTKHYGRTVSNNQVTLLIKYIPFATSKQKLDIKALANKEFLSEKEYKRIQAYIFKYKMYMQSNTINVNSRLNKLKRTPLTYQNPNAI